MTGAPQHGELLSAGYQGAVYKVAAGDRYPGADFVIVKQPMGSALSQWFRRRMIRREYEVYRRLDGVPGIPKCYGLESGGRLVLEFIAGHPLKLSSGELDDREGFFAALLDVLQAAHRAGVAHADLKRKENILVTPDGSPYLIDFGSALICDEGSGALRRWWFSQACQIDLNAWVKHKYLARYDEVSAADAPLYQPTIVERVIRPLRRFWRTITARQLRKKIRRSLR